MHKAWGHYKAASTFDVASISNQIMGVLSLKLTNAQKPAVNSLVNETLNKKKPFTKDGNRQSGLHIQNHY